MKEKLTRDLVYICVISALILLIYWPVRTFDFLIGWDDQWFVTNHYTDGGFSFKNIFSIFSDFYYGQYAPVNQLYYTLLYKFFGYAPAGYHICNLLIHFINSILVYYLLKGILKDIGTKADFEGAKIAALSASVFAVLPINVEPVSWVAASKVLLYAAFYLAALLTYRKYLKTKSPRAYYAVIFFFLLSFGAKEQAVLLPVCLIMFDFVYGRDIKDKLVWLEKLPLIILAALMGIITLDSQQIEGSSDFYNPLQRCVLFFYSVTEYFTKILLPVNLSYLYPFPFQKNGHIPVWMWIHTLSVPLIIILLRKHFTNRLWLFCFSFFLIHVVLVSNAVSLARFSVIADRYAYLSSVGLCLFLGLNFFTIATSKNTKSIAIRTIAVLYMIGLILTSQGYVKVWRNAFSLKARLKSTIELRSDLKTIKNE